ncbi:MAG: HAMP domain-containing histidine kinase [Lachnospiraceae bacterium]|nr:HAMP domain-containing histidine kinase [Lachnospiraceae bacterium]
MGLRKKTFLYSIALSVIMTAFVIGYFVLMLPSLYVDYVMNSNLESAWDIQKRYMENKSYDNITIKNPSSAFSLEVPDEGSEIYVAGKFFRAELTIRDDRLQTILDDIRNILNNTEQSDDLQYIEVSEFEELAALWKDELQDIFAKQSLIAKDYPIEVKVEGKEESGIYKGEYYKFHSMSDGIIVYEAGVSGGNYSYTTYFAFARTDDSFVVTILPTMTPQMEEISPIVMGSIPMIISVTFLVVLVASRFFSGKIVNPIIRLAGYAENARLTERFEADEFDSDSKDEIGALGRNLHELYGKLRDNYEELENKNRILEEENERQEVFLKASSHQLKTPIAAALLLVEGMINEVGKYKNTHEYLPEVKKQLLSMRKIVEDILYLNFRAENLIQEDVSVEMLAEELVKSYSVQTENKQLNVTIEGHGIVTADREMLKKVVDNMFSNAVQYTPEQQEIKIEISDRELCITNYGVTIDEELLPNIFEPFVSGDGSRKGKGLGLYVASYYSRLMRYRLEIENINNGVRAKLLFLY